ncbi:hypothetical protein SAMN02746041_00688 [Desulfacinum hydrothermale DSM 13146]|uniref:Uncharacterized protein n=1 Tax=Desulfacinum hydrothermale DSM 13146 TaxID=1121390 RepID=A0A1W1X6V8_9BACT|nr:hypothetical protein SAMN02746041_00688 [Desulfacinum hydrothermale DSM 13146]
MDGTPPPVFPPVSAVAFLPAPWPEWTPPTGMPEHALDPFPSNVFQKACPNGKLRPPSGRNVGVLLSLRGLGRLEADLSNPWKRPGNPAAILSLLAPHGLCAVEVARIGGARLMEGVGCGAFFSKAPDRYRGLPFLPVETRPMEDGADGNPAHSRAPGCKNPSWDWGLIPIIELQTSLMALGPGKRIGLIFGRRLRCAVSPHQPYGSWRLRHGSVQVVPRRPRLPGLLP